MWLKNNVRELLAIMFGGAFIVFTAMETIPPEAFVGVAVAVVMYYFEERSKDRLREELKQLRGK